MDVKEIELRQNYLKKKKELIFRNKNEKQTYEKVYKISVVLPTFKGEKYVIKCLDSLKNQTLPKDLYEVIIIANGEKDNSFELIEDFISESNLKNFFLRYTETPGASNARNIGLNNCSNEFITFIDDDDYVSNNYLSGMLDDAEENSIVCSYFVDVRPDTKKLVHKNYINKYAKRFSGIIERDLNKMSPLLSNVAGKLIHKDIIGDTRFNSSLASGEDVLFFCEISNKIKNIKVTQKKDVVYYRLLREGSVSRRPLSFDFNVLQRLDVIRELNRLIFGYDSDYDILFIKMKIKSQSGFIKKYLTKIPSDRFKIIEIIKEDRQIKYFPYSYVFNQNKRLVFSYCFAPYNDSSGIVVMKRNCDEFFSKGIISDVIYNRMDKIRNIDHSLSEFSEMFTDKSIELNAPQYFNNKAQINYAVKSFRAALKMRVMCNYKEIYSRVMWPGSHWAAIFYKICFPKVVWTAEFSDPILYREDKLRKSGIFKYVDNFWFWLEFLTYLLSDKIIYTNKNQMEYMLSYFPIRYLKRRIINKSIVENQPYLIKKYYDFKYYQFKGYENDSVYKIKIGYFGRFYKNRDLSIVLDVIDQLDLNIKKKLHIFVFTNDLNEINEYIREKKLDDIVTINKYVDYFSFLNLCKEFDVLLVVDAITIDKMPINPYLPSKYSDYKGSGSSIWAVTEDNSPLSFERSIQYFSKMNDVDSIINNYYNIYNDFKRE